VKSNLSHLTCQNKDGLLLLADASMQSDQILLLLEQERVVCEITASRVLPFDFDADGLVVYLVIDNNTSYYGYDNYKFKKKHGLKKEADTFSLVRYDLKARSMIRSMSSLGFSFFIVSFPFCFRIRNFFLRFGFRFSSDLQSLIRPISFCLARKRSLLLTRSRAVAVVAGWWGTTRE
jgi:hypothetical protein